MKLRTSRMETAYIESGPQDGIPVVLVHGNLSTGRFFEHLFERRARPLPPDRARHARLRRLRAAADRRHARAARLGRRHPRAGRGAGDRAPRPPRGLVDRRRRDRRLRARPPGRLADLHRPGLALRLRRHAPRRHALLPRLGRQRRRHRQPRLHRAPGGGRPLRRRPDRAAQRARRAPTGRRATTSRGWRSCSTRCSSRSPATTATPATPTPSEHWPGVAPGTRGILNALSGKYCNWAGIVDLDPKPPILWTHGTEDIVVADGSPWEMGTLGSLGAVPGWPGEEVFPPQPMVGPDPRRARALPRGRRPRRDRDVRGLRPLPADRRGGALERAVLRLPRVPSSSCPAVAVSDRCSPPRAAPRSSVRWVEPGRRRRRRLPLLPFAILILLLAAGGAVAYVLHERSQQHAELRDAAVRFAKAWEQRKPGGHVPRARRRRALEVLGPALRRRLPDGRRAGDRAQGHRRPDRRGARRAACGWRSRCARGCSARCAGAWRCR